MVRLYNTATRQKEEFQPLEPGKVKMYVCGPTVYNYIHVGNARTFVCFDIIRRYLMWRGFDVTYVQNVTDVDDKIINRANEEGRTAADVAQEYTAAFIEDMHALAVLDPDVRPKATEEIEAMIDLVQRLIDTGHAYEAAGDVYFSVRSHADYGELSHRDVDELESGHRDLRAAGSEGIDARKRDPLDFAVWKAAKPGEPSWSSPWGQGRPGWHCECSAMSRKYLGLPFDIHGGGSDLVFPHHENETAQSKAAYGTDFARYWLHSGMLQVNAEKMSKSLGNFLLLREVLANNDANVLRMLVAQTHYRSPLDFGEDRLAEAKAALERITGLVERIDWAIDNAHDGAAMIDGAAMEQMVEQTRAGFIEHMDDDFNSAGALGAVFGLVGEVNACLGDGSIASDDVAAVRSVRDLLVELMDVFGISAEAQGSAGYPTEVVPLAQELADYDGDDVEQAIEVLLACRQEARAQKNFEVADKVRDGLAALGLKIEDTPQGARITVS